MFTRIRDIWYWLQLSLWYIPALLIIISILFAALFLQIDIWIAENEQLSIPAFMITSPDSALFILSTISSSMITVAGVAFSVSVVAVSLASSQFGPRVLPNFMADKGNQVVLGVFIATFLYSLIVLREIPEENTSRIMPSFSLFMAIVAVVINIGFFVYFVHHIYLSVQVDTIIARSAIRAEKTIDSIYSVNTTAATFDPSGLEWESAIFARRNGYVQDYDESGLLHLAQKFNMIVDLQCKPGQFVIANTPVMRVSVLPKNRRKKIESALLSQLVLGAHRTPIKDILYQINQFVQIALLSLPPAMNDPLTAMLCIDRISEALSKIVSRPVPSNFLTDSSGTVRLIVQRISFSDLLRTSVDPIRLFGKNIPDILVHLIHSLIKIAEHCTRESDLKALIDMGNLCNSTGSFDSESDSKIIRQAYDALVIEGNKHFNLN